MATVEVLGRMAGMELCEPRDLYNILNQQWLLPRVADPYYLCLLGEPVEPDTLTH